MPRRGIEKTSGASQVRQFDTTMMSASAAAIAARTSSSARSRTSDGMPWSAASSATDSLKIFSYGLSLSGWVTTRATSWPAASTASMVRRPQVM